MSTAEANKAVIRRFLDAALQGRLEVFDEICSPDFSNHAAPQRARGVQGLKDVVEFSLRVQPDQVMTTQFVLADDDFVAVYGVREATWMGEGFQLGAITPPPS